MLNFGYLKKCLGIVSATHFCVRFFRQNDSHVIFYKLTKFSWSGCLYFLGYWLICVLHLFVNQVVMSLILKLTLSFQSSHFLYMTKKSTQKIKYLENKKRFRSEIKSISHYFKGFLIAKNCLRPEMALLIRV